MWVCGEGGKGGRGSETGCRINRVRCGRRKEEEEEGGRGEKEGEGIRGKMEGRPGGGGDEGGREKGK